jgi:hypothetical protein
MPSLRPYISQEASRGRALHTSRVTPEGVDISGALRGVSQAADTITRNQSEQAATAAKLKEAQEREAKALQADEARMGVERTMSAGAAKWTERMAEAQQSAPKDAAGFTEGLLKEFDTWKGSESEANQDPIGRKLLEHNLLQMRQKLHAEAFKFEVTQRRTALVDDYSQGVNDELSAVLVDPSLWAGAVARKRGLAQSLQLAPAVREKMERDAVERLSAAAATGIINQPGGPEAFLSMVGARSAKGPKGKDGSSAPNAAERVASNPLLSSMTPQALQSSIDRASMLVAQQEQARESAQLRALAEQDRRLKHAEAEFKVFQSLADKGTALAPEYVNRALAATSGTPFQEGIRGLAAQAKETGGYAAQPLAAQRGMLNALDAEIAQKGRSPEMDKRREALEKVVRGTEADLKAEPLTAGLQRGWITDFTPLQLGGGIDALSQQIAARVPQAAAVAQKAGSPVSPLTGEEARDVFSRIAAQPVAQRSQSLAALAKSMPPEQAQALAAQLDGQSKSDQNRAFAAALSSGADRTTAGRFTSEIILKGAEALQAKTIKEERTPVDGWRGRIGKITEAAYRNPREAEFIADKARFILAGLVAEGASGSERDVTTAVTLAAGGSISDHNGARIPLPAGMDLGDLRKKLGATTPDALKLPDGKVYINTGSSLQEMSAADFIKALPNARLTYAARGRYFVQSGGTFAAKANGDPVVIEVGP